MKKKKNRIKPRRKGHWGVHVGPGKGTLRKKMPKVKTQLQPGWGDKQGSERQRGVTYGSLLPGAGSDSFKPLFTVARLSMKNIILLFISLRIVSFNDR